MRLPIVMISAERSELGAELNADRTLQMKALLEVQGFEFQEVEGRYKGTSERSFMVFTEARIPTLMHFAREFNQESILIVGPNSNAYLIMAGSGAIKDLPGRFKELNEEQIEGAEAYTVINNQYWGVI